MTTCLCGATGFYNRVSLAGHIQEKHGPMSPARALVLAQRIMDKIKLAAEDYAAFGVEPPSVTAAPSRVTREAAQVRELKLPSDEALHRTVATKLPCARCTAQYETVGELAAHLAYIHVIPNDRAMDEAERVAGACPGCGRKTGAHNKTCPSRSWQPPPAPSPAPLRVVPPPTDDARVAQPEERRGATPEVTGSSPVPRSTPSTPAAPATLPAPEEIPMAKPEDCKVCARLSKKAGEPTKCKRHGGAGVKKTPGGAKKPAKVRAATRPPKPEPALASGNGKFAAHITGLKQAVAAGVLAQAELDGYKTALA